jgi:pyruvate/2-oxoglutarate dehydrogenase complex dihydrolipoamide acyltransferase (E2) component
MTATFHILRSSHPEDDALGRVFGPGELIPDLDVDAAFNQEKIASGVFFEVDAPDGVPDPDGGEQPPDAGSGAPNATDAAIRLAEESKIDLSTIIGSGKDNRIEKPDVQAAIDARDEAHDDSPEGDN